MTDDLLSSDTPLLDLLRKRGALTVPEIGEAMGVTATAVRQRLNRLMAQRLIQRTAEIVGRGRPSHKYELTDAGRRKTGSNFADLAIALWQEIREIKDPEVRQGLLQRVARRLADTYAGQISGRTLAEKMESLAELLGERRIPFEVDETGMLPVLTALACPYPELAEQDRTICAMERMLFSELLGETVKLTECRLDGESCCTFEARDTSPQAAR
ncbi:MAG: MarR family transcriptional regulator [Planctomycetales bacterium]|nr:MarR family transcriptional regulator [Planctomycetales bacterium]